MKCIQTNWEPQHEDPMVVEAIERIIAAGEPTPQIGVTYRQVGSYYKINGYEGILLDEFDWTEYEIKCSDGEVRSPQVFWNKDNFELVEEKFEPDTYIPNLFGGDDCHGETTMMVIELEFNIKSDE